VTPFNRLCSETMPSRQRFLSIPIVKHALVHGGSRELYLDFLAQAYHHVRHTFPLLALAASMTRDPRYQEALVTYMNEERGHEKWILDDIRAMGGDADKVAHGKPGIPCQAMVAYCYYAIQWISPYTILGMVHVLEGLSVELAHRLARAIQQSLGTHDKERGFSYLNSHGGLDVEHVELFKSLVNGFENPEIVDQIVDSAHVMYRLYGAIFEEIGLRDQENAHAA
jgi:pyrroloquinoline quinone (PQQ) biosynthesis protein C